MKILKYIPIILISLVFIACGDDKDEPIANHNSLVGYWALSHIKTIDHTANGHTTSDQNVPPQYLDSYAGANSPRWNVLIFDEDYVTIRGAMPNTPRPSDYEDSIDGERQYLIDLENWKESIGSLTDENACPVGFYSIKNNNLIVGSLDMGKIFFTSDNEFTLDYKKQSPESEDYTRLIFTYTRIYSLY